MHSHPLGPIQPSRHRTAGVGAFTIIELLVVISIIALLISILLPSLASARDRARFIKWAGYSHNLRAENSLSQYFNFEQQGEGHDELWNRAVGTPAMVNDAIEPEDYNATFGNVPDAVDDFDPPWDEGRWKGKGALNFDGGDGVSTNTGDHLRHKGTVDRSRGTIFAWVLPKEIQYAMIYYVSNANSDGFTGVNGVEISLALQQVSSTSARGFAEYEFDLDDNTHRAKTKSGASGEIEPDQWHLMAMTWNRKGNLSLYLNNKNGTTTNMSNTTFGDIHETDPRRGRIGSTANGHKDRFLDGLIDELGISNREFSQDEIHEMYRVGKPRRRD